ncbi:MAG: hypothetical protein WBF93_09890 [Pirellulales bacterium]
MYFCGLPGGSNGGRPIGSVAFWIGIVFTAIAVTAFTAFLLYAANEMQIGESMNGYLGETT